MHEEIVPAHRLSAFSDAVIAVIITIMVLELKAPDNQTLSELWPLWPTAISYAVSYLFIAIIWINHHYLMRSVDSLTPRLIWINFAHLFMVSLLPFATAWIARTQLSSAPVAFYAAIFVCVGHCLQCVRAGSIHPSEHRADIRTSAAYGEASITHCSRNFHERHAGRLRRAAVRVRFGLQCPDPSLTTRGTWHIQWMADLDCLE